MSKKPFVSKKEIVEGLKQLGLKEGDSVIVHSALTSFGKVEGGAEGLIDALLELIGPEGTLLMPCFGAQPLDIENTPTNLGAVPETFRKRKGVVRSRNPLSSVVAYGKKAEYYVKDHEKIDCPYTEGSPYIKLAEDNGYILLLGVDQDRNTTLHSVEALAKAPYMKPKSGKWIDENGKIQEKTYQYCAGPHRNFIGVDPMLRKEGICKVGKIGNCVVRLMRSKDLIDFLVPKVKENPFLFLSMSNDYWDGVRQRGMVRKETLERYGVNLVAQTSSMGDNIEDVFWYATLAGVNKLEIDIINGKDISDFDDDELKYLKNVLEKKGFSVETIRCRLNSSLHFDGYIKSANLIGAKAIVFPLVGSAANIKEKITRAKDAGLEVYLENVLLGCEDVGRYISELEDAELAFNPAQFAMVGELPFLKSFRYRQVKKRIGYLILEDITRDGRPAIPGEGKAEVREIVSILLASSFSGPIVIKKPIAAPFTIDQVIEATWNLLSIAGVEISLK